MSLGAVAHERLPDRQFGDQSWVDLAPAMGLEDLGQPDGEEDVRSAFELIAGQVTPAVELREDCFSQAGYALGAPASMHLLSGFRASSQARLRFGYGTMGPMRLAGVDGCRAGWFVVVEDTDTGAVVGSVERNLEAFVLAEGAPEIVAIDIPIGLPDKGPRACDQAARKLLGPRGASVFPAPIRAVLECDDWESACQARARIDDGKRISKQAWAIVSKIKQVDDLLRKHEVVRRRLREVHPEVCFREMNKGTPMSHAKKRSEGRRQRLERLKTFFRPEDLAFALDPKAIPRKDAARDDILDAFAALWTARRLHTAAASVLPESPPRDSYGLLCQILY